jgi:outer membrane protein OmpA-like peptidoglycan-associated protein
VLNQAALVMRAQHAKKWRIVVAAEAQRNEEKTRKLSQARADAVKAYLVKKAPGLDPASIEAIGAVSDTPTVIIIATERDSGATPPPAQAAPEIEIQPGG